MRLKSCTLSPAAAQRQDHVDLRTRLDLGRLDSVVVVAAARGRAGAGREGAGRVRGATDAWCAARTGERGPSPRARARGGAANAQLLAAVDQPDLLDVDALLFLQRLLDLQDLQARARARRDGRREVGGAVAGARVRSGAAAPRAPARTVLVGSKSNAALRPVRVLTMICAAPRSEWVLGERGVVKGGGEEARRHQRPPRAAATHAAGRRADWRQRACMV